MRPPATRLVLPDEAATESLGQRLAAVIGPGDILTLSGRLGAGKTVLARAYIRAAIGADIEVPSPTFTMVQTYELERGTIWHFDLYRLTLAEDVWELGLEEALAGLALLIEWPERLDDMVPRDRLEIVLESDGADDRRLALLITHGKNDLAHRAGLL